MPEATSSENAKRAPFFVRARCPIFSPPRRTSRISEFTVDPLLGASAKVTPSMRGHHALRLERLGEHPTSFKPKSLMARMRVRG